MPGRDARDAIKPLFQKMLNPAAAQNFEEHLEEYIMHVKTRAEVKKQEMLEADDDESEYVPLQGEHVGPGGLDPAEVFETLPQVMQDAFGERSIEALKQALQALKPEDAQYHMKRCVGQGCGILRVAVAAEMTTTMRLRTSATPRAAARMQGRAKRAPRSTTTER